jgi:hypothetical protein
MILQSQPILFVILTLIIRNILKIKNPNLKKPYNTPGSSEIDSLKLDVIYKSNNCPVAIDWIRIECKTAQDLQRGLYDSSLIANAQRAFTNLTSQKFKAKGIRPLRFYTVDEKGDPWIWGSFRYINKLIGNIGTTEINPPYPKHFNYYVNPPNFLPSIGYPTDGLMALPYYSKGSDYHALGHKWGFKLYGSNPTPDTLNSDWEAFFVHAYQDTNWRWLRENASITEYLNILSSSDGYQPVLERMKYSNFYNPL